MDLHCPDLTPLHFSLNGFGKGVMYATLIPATIRQLQQHIIEIKYLYL